MSQINLLDLPSRKQKLNKPLTIQDVIANRSVKQQEVQPVQDQSVENVENINTGTPSSISWTEPGVTDKQPKKKEDIVTPAVNKLLGVNLEDKASKLVHDNAGIIGDVISAPYNIGNQIEDKVLNSVKDFVIGGVEEYGKQIGKNILDSIDQFKQAGESIGSAVFQNTQGDKDVATTKIMKASQQLIGGTFGIPMSIVPQPIKEVLAFPFEKLGDLGDVVSSITGVDPQSERGQTIRGALETAAMFLVGGKAAKSKLLPGEIAKQIEGQPLPVELTSVGGVYRQGIPFNIMGKVADIVSNTLKLGPEVASRVKNAFDSAAKIVEQQKYETSKGGTAGLDVFADKAAPVIQRAGEIATKGVKGVVDTTGKAITGVKKAVTAPIRFSLNKFYGTGTDTIPTLYENLKKNPDFVKYAKNLGVDVTTETLLNKVTKLVNNRSNELAGIGKEYNTVKDIPVNKTLDQSKITGPEGVFTSRGITVNEEGILDFTNTKIGKEGDRNAISKAIKVANRQYETANDVLNARGQIDDLINYDTDITTKGQSVLKAIRSAVDEMSPVELKKIDVQFSPEKRYVKNLRKLLFNSVGDLKPNALSIIINLTNRNNKGKLDILENLYPNIGREVRVLKALGDLEALEGNKIGAYGRASSTISAGLGTYATTGSGLGAVAAGVAALIVSQPSVLFNMIRAFAAVNRIPGKIVDVIKSKIENGNKLTPKEQKVVIDTINEEGGKTPPPEELPPEPSVPIVPEGPVNPALPPASFTPSGGVIQPTDFEKPAIKVDADGNIINNVPVEPVSQLTQDVTQEPKQLTQDVNKVIFNGEDIAKEAKKIGTDGGFSDYTINRIKKENYIEETISINNLLKLDPDLKEYVNANKIRNYEVEEFATRPIVSEKGEVVDGYNRILQAVIDGENTIDIYRGVAKEKQVLDNTKAEQKKLTPEEKKEMKIIDYASTFNNPEDFVKTYGTPLYHSTNAEVGREISGDSIVLVSNKTYADLYTNNDKSGTGAPGRTMTVFIDRGSNVLQAVDKTVLSFSNLEEITRLRESGVDAIKTVEQIGNQPVIIVINPKVITTKSKLVDLWNKAHPPIKSNTGEVMKELPVMSTDIDIPITDVRGNKTLIKKGSYLQAFQIGNGGKVLVRTQKGDITIPKNQFINLKGQSTVSEGKPFVPELNDVDVVTIGTDFIPKIGESTVIDDKVVFDTNIRDLKVIYDKTQEVGKQYIIQYRGLNDKYVPGLVRAEQLIDQYKEKLGNPNFNQYVIEGGVNYHINAIKDKLVFPERFTFDKEWNDEAQTYLTVIKENGENIRGFGGNYLTTFDAEKSLIKNLRDHGNYTERIFYGHDLSGRYGKGLENVFAHSRVTLHSYKKNKDTYFEQEKQSDWTIQKKQGKTPNVLPYDKSPEDLLNDYQKGLVKLTDEQVTFIEKTVMELDQTIDKNEKTKMLNTFQEWREEQKPIVKESHSHNNWLKLIVAADVKKAIENGCKYIAWTTGEQQRNRYHFKYPYKEISWRKNEEVIQGVADRDGRKVIDFKPNGETRTIGSYVHSFNLYIDKEGKVLMNSSEIGAEFQGKNLSSVIGEENAKAILNQDEGGLVGSQLDVLGKFLITLYDETLPKVQKEVLGKDAKIIGLDYGIDGRGMKIATFTKDGKKVKSSDLKLLDEVELRNEKEIIVSIGEGEAISVDKYRLYSNLYKTAKEDMFPFTEVDVDDTILGTKYTKYEVSFGVDRNNFNRNYIIKKVKQNIDNPESEYTYKIYYNNNYEYRVDSLEKAKEYVYDDVRDILTTVNNVSKNKHVILKYIQELLKKNTYHLELNTVKDNATGVLQPAVELTPEIIRIVNGEAPVIQSQGEKKSIKTIISERKKMKNILPEVIIKP